MNSPLTLSPRHSRESGNLWLPRQALGATDPRLRGDDPKGWKGSGFSIRNVLLAFSLLWLLTFPAHAAPFAQKLSDAALERTQHQVRYDGRYMTIPYPNGDVPPEIGVCSDEIIRSYRALGIDLQKLVHEDMRAHFNLYPKTWGLKRPDPNIDHRRVPNLQVFFTRHGQQLPVSRNASDYAVGDMVTWNVGGARTIPHIGIITHRRSADGQRPLVVHNIGAGPQAEDVLFAYELTGHYRYEPAL